MSEFLDAYRHYREYGVQTFHVYSQSQNGAIHDETYAQMGNLSDFEAGSFYNKPKEKPKLKTHWRGQNPVPATPQLVSPPRPNPFVK